MTDIDTQTNLTFFLVLHFLFFHACKRRTSVKISEDREKLNKNGVPRVSERFRAEASSLCVDLVISLASVLVTGTMRATHNQGPDSEIVKGWNRGGAESRGEKLKLKSEGSSKGKKKIEISVLGGAGKEKLQLHAPTTDESWSGSDDGNLTVLVVSRSGGGDLRSQ